MCKNGGGDNSLPDTKQAEKKKPVEFRETQQDVSRELFLIISFNSQKLVQNKTWYLKCPKTFCCYLFLLMLYKALWESCQLKCKIKILKTNA